LTNRKIFNKLICQWQSNYCLGMCNSLRISWTIINAHKIHKVLVLKERFMDMSQFHIKFCNYCSRIDFFFRFAAFVQNNFSSHSLIKIEDEKFKKIFTVKIFILDFSS
jgi:hypothetical protein